MQKWWDLKAGERARRRRWIAESIDHMGSMFQCRSIRFDVKNKRQRRKWKDGQERKTVAGNRKLKAKEADEYGCRLMDLKAALKEPRRIKIRPANLKISSIKLRSLYSFKLNNAKSCPQQQQFEARSGLWRLDLPQI